MKAKLQESMVFGLSRVSSQRILNSYRGVVHPSLPAFTPALFCRYSPSMQVQKGDGLLSSVGDHAPTAAENSWYQLNMVNHLTR
jgi:hypothetical protein